MTMFSRKEVFIFALVLGLLFISFNGEEVEGRSMVSGWMTANHPDMYNVGKKIPNGRRLDLLLRILRRKIHLTRMLNDAGIDSPKKKLPLFTPLVHIHPNNHNSNLFRFQKKFFLSKLIWIGIKYLLTYILMYVQFTSLSKN